MIKGILFDLDGTLLDTNELIYKSFEYTFLKGLNINPSKEEITSLYGQPLNYSFKRYIEDENKINELITMYREYNEKIHDDMCFPFEGVLELLKGLKEKEIKIGIVTSKREVLAKRGMEIGKIIDYMDVIVTPEYTKNHKPHKEPAEYACKMLKIDPKEAIMVGDSPFDLICGKEAGCKTCGVKYSALDIKLLKDVEPDFLIENPIDILEII